MATNLYDQARRLPLMPEKMVNLELQELGLDNNQLIELNDELAIQLSAKLAHLVIRPSGTQPLLRVWGADDRGIDYIKRQIRDTLHSIVK